MYEHISTSLFKSAFCLRSLIAAMLLTVMPCMYAIAQVKQSDALNLIQAAIGDKAGRSATETKLESSLMFALRALSPASGLNRVPQYQQQATQSFIDTKVSADQSIFIVIRAKVSSDLLAAIQAAGGYEISDFHEYETVTARVPIASVLGLASRSDVVTIGPQELFQTNRYIPTTDELKAITKRLSDGLQTNAGSVTWQGVVAHKANLAHAVGITGSGVKVCVLSDGVNSLSASQASQNLGAVTVLPGQAGSGDEGTAMLEIIHDMAPGASLFFATSNPSSAQFATNILNLKSSYGCDIIVDDITYISESAFIDGPIAQAVNYVTRNGVLYFSSAANSGNLTHGSSGTFEGDFVPSGSTAPTLHMFGSNPYTTITYPTSTISLQWSDPRAGSNNDYDLFVMDSNLANVIASSTIVQNGSQAPYEQVNCQNCEFPVGSKVLILNKSGIQRGLRLDTFRGKISNGTTGSTFGHNAALGAITIGAVDVSKAAGGPYVGGATNSVNDYSSDGPRKMFFNPNGSPITPGNFLFSTNGGTIIPKVDFAAADCGTTSAPGFSHFCGTSAAAPTAASIAALIKSKYPSATSSGIYALMATTALNIEAAGVDRDSGFGLVMTPSTLYVSAPNIGAAVPGNAVISVAFTPGPLNGATLISYSVGCTNDNVNFIFASGANSPVVVSGLTNGLAYQCYALTTTSQGSSDWSAASNTVTPAAPPAAPTSVSITVLPGKIQASFTAPANTGGSSITSYTLTCSASGQATKTATGTTSPITLSGLTSRVAYSCTVYASNTASNGVASSPVVVTGKSIDMSSILMLLLDD